MERTIQGMHRCFLFGLYDSRGGGYLVEAPHLHRALEIWAKMWSLDPNSESSPDEDKFHVRVQEEFLGYYNVIVFDEEFGSIPRDLDAKYHLDPSDGYSYGEVQTRYNGQWFPLGTKTLVFWKGDIDLSTVWNHSGPAFKFDPDNTRLIKRSFGEDAHGLMWHPYLHPIEKVHEA